jgi:hypothetical protein
MDVTKGEIGAAPVRGGDMNQPIAIAGDINRGVESGDLNHP